MKLKLDDYMSETPGFLAFLAVFGVAVVAMLSIGSM